MGSPMEFLRILCKGVKHGVSKGVTSGVRSSLLGKLGDMFDVLPDFLADFELDFLSDFDLLGVGDLDFFLFFLLIDLLLLFDFVFEVPRRIFREFFLL